MKTRAIYTKKYTLERRNFAAWLIRLFSEQKICREKHADVLALLETAKTILPIKHRAAIIEHIIKGSPLPESNKKELKKYMHLYLEYIADHYTI